MALSISFSDICSIVWAKTKLSIVDSYRFRVCETKMVSTKSGPVKGYKMGSSFDYQYLNFIGIPYAKPPIGELRFKDPQPFEPSESIINEKFGRGGSMACQGNSISKKSIGNEDCLHLSVYTRDITPDKLKPVMVWIHGGAFIMGSNAKDTYNPEYLLRYDVVVITINYRLGAFGLLSLNDPELGIPGNAGLKDQTMALKWIKENCMHFGGDPENIMVFGESAGAASISMHLISDFSKGLFHKAFLMSGTAYAPWVISPVKNWTQRIAAKLGWNGEGGDKACLNVLQQASQNAIIKAQEELLTAEDRKRYVLFPFSPVVEPYESSHCFLSKDPLELFKSAWSKDIPVIIGNCSDEGFLLYKYLMQELKKSSDVKLEYTLAFLDSGVDVEVIPQYQEIAEHLKKFYFGYSKLSVETILIYLMILNDTLFAHPTHRMILSRMQTNSAATYLLRFNFDSKRNMVKKLFVDRNVPGVCHGDDFAYYFRSVMSGSDPPNGSKEWNTIERMCHWITSFAKTNDPNNDVIAPVQWKPLAIETINDKPQYKCLNIADDVSFIDLPEMERMHFWDQVYNKLNKNII